MSTFRLFFQKEIIFQLNYLYRERSINDRLLQVVDTFKPDFLNFCDFFFVLERFGKLYPLNNSTQLTNLLSLLGFIFLLFFNQRRIKEFNFYALRI